MSSIGIWIAQLIHPGDRVWSPKLSTSTFGVGLNIEDETAYTIYIYVKYIHIITYIYTIYIIIYIYIYIIYIYMRVCWHSAILSSLCEASHLLSPGLCSAAMELRPRPPNIVLEQLVPSAVEQPNVPGTVSWRQRKTWVRHIAWNRRVPWKSGALGPLP